MPMQIGIRSCSMEAVSVANSCLLVFFSGLLIIFWKMSVQVEYDYSSFAVHPLVEYTSSPGLDHSS
jgi:hypothetical protein